jgi:DNA mismatch endonuclease (patch repair protein)
MADVFSRKERSAIMRRVRAENTKPELRVRRWLHSQGFRFRLHRGDLPGKPDIVLPKLCMVIFVHGCFWHGHAGCKHSTLPQSNREYWERKIGRNVTRDRRNARALRKLGWRVLTLWECRIGDDRSLERRLGFRLRLG